MSTERIVQLARALPREEFARKLQSLFLVVLDSGEEEPPSSFETVDASVASNALSGAKPALEVHEIAKAKGNPYPDRLSLGRARNCDVVLRHASVSKLHARFSPRPDGQLDLVDVGSQIGTRVNGRTLEPNKPERVAPGFILLIGRVIARVADARIVWDLIKAHERLDEGATTSRSSPIPPPRASSAGLPPRPSSAGSPSRGSSPGPAPRASSPEPLPRGSSPGPEPRASSPASKPPLSGPPGSVPPGSVPPRSR
jgi:hypothetical protein